jgi:AraC-like DNA-binding protein
MRTTLEERVRQFEQGDYWMARIQAQMDAQLPLGEPTLQSVADALQVPPGVISKALMQAQTPFASLLDAQRQRCLKQYLKTDMPLLQVAMQLGYSEQSALTRACKRWFGMTPVALRRQLQEQGD